MRLDAESNPDASSESQSLMSAATRQSLGRPAARASVTDQLNGNAVFDHRPERSRGCVA